VAAAAVRPRAPEAAAVALHVAAVVGAARLRAPAGEAEAVAARQSPAAVAVWRPQVAVAEPDVPQPEEAAAHGTARHSRAAAVLRAFAAPAVWSRQRAGAALPELPSAGYAQKATLHSAVRRVAAHAVGPVLPAARSHWGLSRAPARCGPRLAEGSPACRDELVGSPSLRLARPPLATGPAPAADPALPGLSEHDLQGRWPLQCSPGCPAVRALDVLACRVSAADLAPQALAARDPPGRWQ
jgi:hypothetical protein